MNWLKSLTTTISLLWLAGCGVKGDPLPPEKPPELGRGRPTYKSATQGIKIEKVSNTPAEQGKEDDDDQRE